MNLVISVAQWEKRESSVPLIFQSSMTTHRRPIVSDFGNLGLLPIQGLDDIVDVEVILKGWTSSDEVHSRQVRITDDIIFLGAVAGRWLKREC